MVYYCFFILKYLTKVLSNIYFKSFEVLPKIDDTYFMMSLSALYIQYWLILK